jgi:hypothetical protein
MSAADRDGQLRKLGEEYNRLVVDLTEAKILYPLKVLYYERLLEELRSRISALGGHFRARNLRARLRENFLIIPPSISGTVGQALADYALQQHVRAVVVMNAHCDAV